MNWLEQERLEKEQEEQKFQDSLNWLERLMGNDLQFVLVFTTMILSGFMIGFLIGMAL